MPNSTLRRCLLATAAIAGSLIPAVGPTSGSAHAAGCVTRAEYRSARQGMTQAQVARRFGTWGRITESSQAGGWRSVERQYRTCFPGLVAANFSNTCDSCLPGSKPRLNFKQILIFPS